MKSKMILISCLIFLTVVLGSIVTNKAHAALSCALEVHNGQAACNLTHTRPSGFLHTSHLWSAGNLGSVSPRITFGESTFSDVIAVRLPPS